MVSLKWSLDFVGEGENLMSVFLEMAPVSGATFLPDPVPVSGTVPRFFGGVVRFSSLVSPPSAILMI